MLIVPPPQPVQVPQAPSNPTAVLSTGLRVLRWLTWLYLALWLIEGALRKWILPGFANPLLVVRDPVLLLMYFLALREGIFPKSLFVFWALGQGIIALFVSMAVTEVPLVIQLYGFRASYLHLPLIFLLPQVLNGRDLRRVGFWTLVCSLPMAALVLFQFESSPGAWINSGAGGGANGQIESAFGHIRPSGTFSFTNGLAGFSVLVSAFFLWQLFEAKLYPRLLWLASGVALVVLIALSGSRSAVGAVGLILAAAVVIGTVQPRYWGSTVKLLAVVGLGMLLIGSFSVFKDGLDVFSARFGNADRVQTGFFGRALESLYTPLQSVEYAETFGVGLGMGTNAASGIINEGKRAFMLSEGDVARVILESGPMIGLSYELLRVLIAATLGVYAVRSLYQQANTLPVLIFSGVFASILVGEFAQPTELGYTTIAAGLCLAANQAYAKEADPLSAPGSLLPSAGLPPQLPRGRSLYAERLHAPNSGSGPA